MSIIYEKRDHVAYITISNPEKANILDKATSDALSDAWKEVWEDRDVRVAILTGEGDRYFCAGHNLAPRPDVTDEERERLRLQRTFWPLSGTVNGGPTGVDGRMGDHYPQIWKPVIGAINGWAAGAGFYIMLTSTDIRVACEEHARFKFALLTLTGSARPVEEGAELKAATKPEEKAHELGDLLFTMVNLTRWSGAHAEDALRQANQRFGKRYLSMERLASERGVDFEALPLEQKEELWQEAKRLVG